MLTQQSLHLEMHIQMIYCLLPCKSLPPPVLDEEEDDDHRDESNDSTKSVTTHSHINKNEMAAKLCSPQCDSLSAAQAPLKQTFTPPTFDKFVYKKK